MPSEQHDQQALRRLGQGTDPATLEQVLFACHGRHGRLLAQRFIRARRLADTARAWLDRALPEPTDMGEHLHAEEALIEAGMPDPGRFQARAEVAWRPIQDLVDQVEPLPGEDGP